MNVYAKFTRIFVIGASFTLVYFFISACINTKVNEHRPGVQKITEKGNIRVYGMIYFSCNLDIEF